MSLNVIYKELDFKGGTLLNASDDPLSCRNSNDWIEKGEWLSAAKQAGAQKVFFVKNNPVIVFAECGSDVTEKIKAFNQAWCLARPRLLFLASPGEISVYDLAQKPALVSKPEERKNLKTLNVLRDISLVAEKLNAFHRENIESGKLFGDERFGDLKNRADISLIRDLKTVRYELIKSGLSGEKVRFAHALIGRSIFIRYLEDRGILDEQYFLNVARKKAGWTEIIKNPSGYEQFDFSGNPSFYSRVLTNRDFTYALFESLAKHFNGDMFPQVDDGEGVVALKHLKIIQELLFGNVGIQKKLFFYSYKFNIVPLELISAIYEEFYHPSSDDKIKKEKIRQDGAYYTPPVLAEFVLSQILTKDILKKGPRVLDPACGSGIFLVEAFRRMVRYNWYKKKSSLSFVELKNIIKNQIAGIEVNEEAARITAFSLYLAMLHYLDPPSILEHLRQGNRLPYLITKDYKSKNYYNCILVENTFNVSKIESSTTLQERFGRGCVDIVVGNPPWGTPGKKADEKTKKQHQIMLDWCKINNKPIGDKEPSQAFLWRSLDFLREGGHAGMLVPAGVLFKHSDTSQEFRQQWMKNVKLQRVYNFSNVRKFFFKEGDSPFLTICFSKEKQGDSIVEYWSAKQVVALKKTQAVLFSLYDRHVIRNENFADSKIWKKYWLGRQADSILIKQLSCLERLDSFINSNNSGQGYMISSNKYDASIFGNKLSFKKLPSRYDNPDYITSPKRVHRLGKLKAYSGNRIIVNEGITELGGNKGVIVSQYIDYPATFTESCYGLLFDNHEQWQHKICLGILWSSVARYYFFLTSANWGLWYHKILKDEIIQLPVILDKSNPYTSKVIRVVDKLHNYHPQKKDLLHQDGIPEEEIENTRHKWEAELDEAVFELYELNEEQKDLIRDCCEVTLPFFYKPFDSIGAMPAVENSNFSWLERYVKIFSQRWNAYLDKDEDMRGKMHVSAHGNMLAVEFFPSDKKDQWNLEQKNDSWKDILEQINKNLPQPMGTSQILLDGLVHVVSNDGIIIIKRNEKRFWTRSLAREDAEITLVKAMQKNGRKS